MKKTMKMLLCYIILFALCLPLAGCESQEEIDLYRQEQKKEIQYYAFGEWKGIATNSIFTPESLQTFETYLSEGLEQIESAPKKNIPKIVEQTKQKMDSVDRQPCTELAEYWHRLQYSKDQSFQESFLDENSTYGIKHVEKEWLSEHPGEPIPDEYVVYDYTSPLWRAFIITDRDRLDEVFKTSPEIDFEKEIVFIFMFSRYDNRPEARTMTYDGQKLKINIKQGLSTDGRYVSGIGQFIYAYKMAKTNVTSIEVLLDYDLGKGNTDSIIERAITELKADAKGYLQNNIYTPENMLLFETYLSEGMEAIEKPKDLALSQIVEQTVRKLDSVDRLSCNEIAQSQVSYIGLPSVKFKESFIEENGTYGIGYVDKEWLSENPNEKPISDEYVVYNYTSPLWRAYIISDQDRLVEVFKTPPEVDFEKEMVFVFMFSRCDNRPEDRKMTHDGQKLKIDIMSDGRNNARVRQFIYAYKTTKTNVTSIEVLLDYDLGKEGDK